MKYLLLVLVASLALLGCSSSAPPPSPPLPPHCFSFAVFGDGPYRSWEGGRWRKGKLYDRARLVAGNRIAGPAVITELSATTYVPSRWSALVDPFGNLTLTPQGAARR